MRRGDDSRKVVSPFSSSNSPLRVRRARRGGIVSGRRLPESRLTFLLLQLASHSPQSAERVDSSSMPIVVVPSERTNYRSRVVLLSVFFAFFLVVLCAFKGGAGGGGGGSFPCWTPQYHTTF